MANYNKFKTGRLTEITLPNGTKITRQPFVLMKSPLGQISAYSTIDEDDDHFCFQNTLPQADGVKIHPSQMGANVLCTCGSDAVLLLDGPYANKVICRSYLTTGYHQTSHIIKDGILTLNKKAESERTADPDDIVEQEIRFKPKL